MAIMREDLDAVENETQRNVILIRRLKSEQKPPSGKAELNEFLKTAAVGLLADMGVPKTQSNSSHSPTTVWIKLSNPQEREPFQPSRSASNPRKQLWSSGKKEPN